MVLFSTSDTTMQIILSNKYVQLVAYWAVTIAAVIVGISQFVYRGWTENNVNELIRSFLYQLSTFVEKVASAIRTETQPQE
jgi:hypothetical protein